MEDLLLYALLKWSRSMLVALSPTRAISDRRRKSDVSLRYSFWQHQWLEYFESLFIKEWGYDTQIHSLSWVFESQNTVTARSCGTLLFCFQI
jgi:hypothetical protein